MRHLGAVWRAMRPETASPSTMSLVAVIFTGNQQWPKIDWKLGLPLLQPAVQNVQDNNQKERQTNISLSA